MLRNVGNMRNKDVCALLDMSPSAVGNIISRRGLADGKKRRDLDIDAIESEYLAGATTYALGEKYGLYHSTISKMMKKRGHVRGKGKTPHCEHALKKGHETQLKNAIAKLEKKLIEQGGEISLVEFGNYKSTYKCNTCGCVFNRWRDSRGSRICCPECRAKELQKIRVRNGGKIFEPGGHRARCKRYGRIYDPSVTREKLIERDNNTCQICGGVCDSNDKRWGHFGPLTPSIDHVIALKNGGNHVWSNVQLAHAICNIIKNDNDLTEEVITHAKEQAIAYKCA